MRAQAVLQLPWARIVALLFSGSPAFVSMVKTADVGNGDHRSKFRRLHGSRLRGVFGQRQMCPGLVIIRDKHLYMPVKRSLVEDDHMIQALAAYRADDALDVGSLPGATGRGKHFLAAHIADLLHKVVAENPIPIPQEITRCRVPGKRTAELLSGPFHRWMRRYAEVENPATVVCQNQEHVQDLKPDGWHDEEVNRNQAFDGLARKVRHVWDGGFRRRTMYLLTLVSPMPMPSFSSSP